MRYWLTVCSCFLFLFMSISAGASEIRITRPWVAEPPPSTKMLSGYMEITNDSEREVRLTQVSGNDFGKVEMHQTIVQGDTAQMLKQHDLSIRAGETLILKSGSYHLMLMMPKRTLKEGDSTKLMFMFDTGDEILISAPIRKRIREAGLIKP